MDRKELRTEIQHMMDSARQRPKRTGAAFEEAMKSGKEISEDVATKVEEARKEVSKSISNLRQGLRSAG